MQKPKNIDQTPEFHLPLSGLPKSKIEVSNWKVAVDAYQNKDYKESFYALLDCIDPQLRKKFGNADQTSFEVPHGSIVVTVKLIEDRIEVHAPFLQLPETNPVPVLRKVAELNFSPLNMAAIRLEDNNLSFAFQCKLNTCEPFKMYYALKEICQTGDKYDDYFTVKHAAKRLQEPKVTPYSVGQAEQTWIQTCAYIDEAMEYAAYFEGKRWYDFTLDILALALLKIEHYACPQGNIKNELEDAVDYLYEQGSVQDKINSCKKVLLKIKEKGKEAFIADLYQAEIFVPSKSMDSLSDKQKNWEGRLQTATEELNSSNYMAATFTILTSFYYSSFYTTIPADLDNFITSVLEKASGKDWKEAAQLLVNGMKCIIDGNIKPQAAPQATVPASNPSSTSSIIGGLFSKLFGN